MRKFRPKDGENWEDVYCRAKEFLNDLIKNFIKEDYVEEIDFKNSTVKNLNKLDQDFNDKFLRQLENTKIENRKIFELKISEDNYELHNCKNELNKRNTQEIKISSKNSQIFEPENFEENALDKKNDNILLKNIKPYLGFDHSKETNRILVVTHGGFIMELINVIRNKKGLEMNGKNNTYNTAVYVIKIYCSICGGVCNKCEQNKLEYDFIIFNDNSHCVNLK